MDPDQIKPEWRRSGCVGGDCDTLYPAPGGKIAILAKVTGDGLARLQHQPAGHEEAVFIPDDVLAMLRRG